MADLRPIHHSIGNSPRLPHHMTRAPMPNEMREGMTNVALSIFTDCVNVGQPFQTALLAIYLSGLQHGAASKQEGE